MAAVTFNTILLNLASDPTQVVSLWCIPVPFERS